MFPAGGYVGNANVNVGGFGSKDGPTITYTSDEERDQILELQKTTIECFVPISAGMALYDGNVIGATTEWVLGKTRIIGRGLVECIGASRKVARNATRNTPTTQLSGAEAARAALGKGPNAAPGAPLTPQMREALEANIAAAQKSLANAQKGLNNRGNPLSEAQKATQIETTTNRIAEIRRTLESGVQAPKN